VTTSYNKKYKAREKRQQFSEVSCVGEVGVFAQTDGVRQLNLRMEFSLPDGFLGYEM